MTAGADTLAWDIFRSDNALVPEDELRAGFPAEADYAIQIAKRLRELGYLRAVPVFAETLRNDGTHEFTTTADCDGSNVNHWQRTPEMRAVIRPGVWKAAAQ